MDMDVNQKLEEARSAVESHKETLTMVSRGTVAALIAAQIDVPAIVGQFEDTDPTLTYALVEKHVEEIKRDLLNQ